MKPAEERGWPYPLLNSWCWHRAPWLPYSQAVAALFHFLFNGNFFPLFLVRVKWISDTAHFRVVNHSNQDRSVSKILLVVPSERSGEARTYSELFQIHSPLPIVKVSWINKSGRTTWPGNMKTTLVWQLSSIITPVKEGANYAGPKAAAYLMKLLASAETS